MDLCLFPSEATERRASAVSASVERQSSGPSLPPPALLALDGMSSYRRIEEAFHCKLKGPVVIDKKTLVELQNFQTVCVCVCFDKMNNGRKKKNVKDLGMKGPR